ncbi:hypothetical protein, partial [Hymenobacter rubidus]|uniref:hypothetical protein n=1 Tax=Hymenobacter rubidus TaxID=1441626 RepID=UPI00191EBE3A
MSQNSSREVEIKRGYWLYDGLIRKSAIIFCVNYDVYYEMEKDEGFFDMANETPNLNEKGESYLIRWPSKGFKANSGTFSLGGLSIEEAVSEAERIVQQKINWLNYTRREVGCGACPRPSLNDLYWIRST